MTGGRLVRCPNCKKLIIDGQKCVCDSYQKTGRYISRSEPMTLPVVPAGPTLGGGSV